MKEITSIFLTFLLLMSSPDDKKPEIKSIVFSKDTLISTSFVADNVIINNCKVHLKGQYSVGGDGLPIDSIVIGNLQITEGGWMSIQSIDTKVKIDSIDIYRGKFTVTTEAKDFDNGTTLEIGSIETNYLITSCLFFQNIKKAEIGSIIANWSGYNKDLSDAVHKKYGVQVLKWDNALSPKIDHRTAHIGKYIVKNTNLKDSLINEEGKIVIYRKQQISMKALWLDEGTNNVTFDYMDIDMPMGVTPFNEYNPPSTGNHYWKKLVLRGKKPYWMTTIVDSHVDSLIIKDHYLRMTNSTYDYKEGKISITD